MPNAEQHRTFSDEINGQPGGVWRDGNTLIMRTNAPLPDRCVKCNTDADGSHLRRRLSWHHPALALLVFAGLLPYLVAVLIARKSANVNVGLCEQHIKRRRTAIIVSWVLFVLGLTGAVLGIDQENSAYGLVGAALILTSILYAVVGTHVVSVSKMDDQYIWIKRINRDYLDQLPKLPKVP